ncbi:MAG TPA: NADH-quinone oxidoreductase subunit L [Candidatus Goldiibacteriota bacterium]|nr:NADH-quinone oxidoreductase subunit L [Candidatus Goldiibacteriota bacterium]HRQ44276.1 NADH-quinone oxidoreductase subunit L [Candidatus Goldiibacteriota bacterium]
MEQLNVLGLAIPALPLLAFLLITAITAKKKMLSAVLSISCIFASFLISVYLLILQLKAGHGASYEFSFPWLFLGDVKMSLGILINPLTTVMLIVVTTVSMLVQIYSIGYMKGDYAFSRFFSYISLFSFSMLGIVVANNLIQMYIFWELVGLCSYLLIGFWWFKPEAAEASKKAFIVTRFGDFGFLVGILILSYITGTFNFAEIQAQINAGLISPGLLTVIALLLFSGAVGKSAQFPLHVWLPDAMEGPTPVSALIHAATMVAAGVFMVARLFGIFSASPHAMLVIAYLGGFTAIFAATIALTQNDIKRVLAFSTLSQLGYMMLAMGIGGYTSGMFHLTTHAFFKALLFLGAGSVIHAVHTNDIQLMGGLHKKMPITSITFLIASLSIAGIFPLSGFWSKDEILVNIMESGHMGLYYVAAATAFLTAFYMFRLYLMTFTGKPRDAHAYEHAHESPLTMTVPLMILAVLSIVTGFAGIPGKEQSFYNFLFFGAHPHETHFNMGVALSSSAIAVSGIALALLMYAFGLIKPEAVKNASGPLYKLSYNKYYIDEIYMFFIKNGFFVIASAVKWFDRHVVDGAVNLVAFLCRWAGSKLRLTVNGGVQSYALIIFGGLVFIAAVFAVWNPDALKLLGGR